MSRTTTLLKIAAKLSKHQAELARFYTPGTVERFEPEWIAANDDLEDAIDRAQVFTDLEILEEGIRQHFIAISRIMHKMEMLREQLRVAELMKELA